MTRVLTVDKVHIHWAGFLTTFPIVSAIGTVNSGGWTRGRLEPFFYIAAPADGIQDFDFQADPPNGPTFDAILPITAGKLIARPVEDYWGKGKPLVGVRVHSSTNTVEASFDEASPRPALRAAMGDDDPYPLMRKIAALIGDEDPIPYLGGAVEMPFADELGKLLVGRLVRPYYTGSLLTLDYIPERINIEINPTTHRVVQLSFG